MLELADIRRAAARLQGQVLVTPCTLARTLSQIANARVFLKFENLQFTASFKERGACNKLAQLSEQEKARSHALALATQHQLTFVHPYDDEAIIAGQGTVGLEMLEAVPQLDALIVAVGGGGLIAGMTLAAKSVKPGIEVIGVQMLRFPNMFNAFKHAGLPQATGTIAEGIAVGTPGRITQKLIEQYVDDIVLVDEGDIEQAILMLLEVEKTLVEGAGAAPLAALLKYPERFRGRNVGLVLGGGNIDPLLLAAIIERGMVRAGRLARIRVGARDVPGSLARITEAVADAGGNVDEVHHQRTFTSLAAQNVEIELVIQTRGRDHIAAVLEALHIAGFQAKEQT